MLFFKISHCDKSSVPLAESNVKVNYLMLKALTQDTSVIRIIRVTLQSLCFSVRESKSTLSRLPTHCL